MFQHYFAIMLHFSMDISFEITTKESERKRINERDRNRDLFRLQVRVSIRYVTSAHRATYRNWIVHYLIKRIRYIITMCHKVDLIKSNGLVRDANESNFTVHFHTNSSKNQKKKLWIIQKCFQKQTMKNRLNQTHCSLNWNWYSSTWHMPNTQITLFNTMQYIRSAIWL